MKNRRFLVMAAILAALFVGLIAFRLLSNRPHAAQQAGAYYCPMHPSYTSDRPGDCPICNMRLVKRELAREEPASEMEGSSPEGHASLHLSQQKQQLIGVKSATAQMRPFRRIIRSAGRIAYDPELYQAEQEYLQAMAGRAGTSEGSAREMKEQADRLVEASRMRLMVLGLNEGLLEEMVHWAKPDESLILADPEGRVWVYAPVYEFELPHLKVGQKIFVESQALPGQVLEGTLRSIDPVLDPMTRTARIRATLKDPEKILRPEMYVEARVEVEMGERLAVPETALFDTGAKKIVFVDRGEGLFEPRDVAVGTRSEGDAEILEGVSEGERVVVSGNFLIDSESRLKAALEGMGEGGEHRHGQ